MKNNWPNAFLVIVLSFSSNYYSSAQDYYLTTHSPSSSHEVIFLDGLCGCSIEPISSINGFDGGISWSPDGELFFFGTLPSYTHAIFLVAPNSGILLDTFMLDPVGIPFGEGFLSVDSDIFYFLPYLGANSDSVYLWDINANTITSIGSIGMKPHGELAISDGNAYVPIVDSILWNRSIINLDLNDPENSEIVVTYPFVEPISGLTASPYCNVLIGVRPYQDDIVSINLIDGTILPICPITNGIGNWITSMNEFNANLECSNFIDLDCNDSSGAEESDYNSLDFTCLSNGIEVADQDISLFFDAIISSMNIAIVGSVPDDPFEILDMTGSVPNINTTGVGTDMITLTNAGGAKSTDFKDALRMVVYKNLASPLTPGPRTVEVQFTTESGGMSNVATAFIEVTELPLVDVDLGDDVEVCDGESVVLDAGITNADYTWSTSAQTQTISVFESGQYSVTVEDGVNCPGKDTVEVEVVPVVQVSLIGDEEICDNEEANLLIQTNTPFSLSVEIQADPGSPFNFPSVNDDFPFTDIITQTTTYVITNVTPSQGACIDITDPYQIVEVYPTYTTSVDTSICDGDSIWLGFGWEFEAGVYENTLATIYGCDSVVTTNLMVLPAIQISQSSTTCDSASAGVFITYLSNPVGCDTVVTTTITLLASDTTQLQIFSCIQSSTGVTSQTLTNQNGCDSLVITTTSWTPPLDTTFLNQFTCDSSALGVFQSIIPAQDGCDSMIIASVNLAPSDTTYLSNISCDSASIGVSQSLFSNHEGCDSLVITTIIAGSPDTTLQFSTSCDSSSLGVFETHFTTANQCDSLVIQTVTYSAQDSTFISEGTCDPAQTGTNVFQYSNVFGCDSIVTQTIYLLSSSESFINGTTCDPDETGSFTDTLINHFGCDSIIHLEVSLLPSDQTFLQGTTCRSSEAGVFVTNLQNQFGCDSIVTTTVTLIPADTTTLTSQTCDPAQTGETMETFVNQDGCDSVVNISITLFPLPQLSLVVTSDFNGYAISCFGESDGSAIAQVNGIPLFQYNWNTTDTTQSITALSAGTYVVTITDGNGCQEEGEITLNEPAEFSIGFLLTEPGCFDNQQGTIEVIPSGGVLPIRYSIDAVNYQSSPIFNNLPAGTYTITVLDDNDCETKEIVWINVPLPVNVDLGDDQIIQPGDTTIIAAVVDLPIDSLINVSWTGLSNAACPTCLEQPVAPIISSAYSISVTNTFGCSDSDSVIVFVENNIDVYVPNIFSPNGDGVNDRFVIGAGPQVEVIESLQIFDRWGNMVFEANDFVPNDVNAGWDGMNKGERLNPAVYAYRLMLKFKDGRIELRNGDVTLLR